MLNLSMFCNKSQHNGNSFPARFCPPFASGCAWFLVFNFNVQL